MWTKKAHPAPPGASVLSACGPWGCFRMSLKKSLRRKSSCSDEVDVITTWAQLWVGVYSRKSRGASGVTRARNNVVRPRTCILNQAKAGEDRDEVWPCDYRYAPTVRM